MNTQNLLLFLSVLLTALVAGLFYGYSCSVNPGLGKLDDAGYLKAMQSINRAILNPYFFVSYMGALIALIITSYYTYMYDRQGSFYFIVAALFVYGIGVFGITAFGNIPLNNTLENLDLISANASELAEQRSTFEMPWNRYHTVRTIAAILSCALSIISIFKSSLR